MTKTPVKASAPGSVMITGEHAVVYGHPAIVCAIDQRAYVEAGFLPEARLEVYSEIAPPLSVPIDNLPPSGPYRFVVAAVKQFRDKIPCGLKLTITSEIDPTLGLGSSAAVTIACLGALEALTGSRCEGLHTAALDIVRQIQGRGSGADLAASLSGGMLSYQLPEDLISGSAPIGIKARLAPLPSPPALSLCYCGYKTPTAEVLAKVAKAAEGREDAFAALYERMGRAAAAAITAAGQENWQSFGTALTDYQSLMEELGVSDPTLKDIIEKGRQYPGVLAAKISGSGLGDCVVAVGALPEHFVPAPVASEGLRIDE